MPPSLKLSIVTPSFNSIHTVKETLESVAYQDYPHVEHVVIDAGSTDGTLEILKSYPSVHWISEPDEGLYHAMNKGIQMATGGAVGILNADDCYCPGILGKVAAAFVAHPNWDALFGDYIFVDANGQEIYRREEACWDPQIVRFGLGIALHQALFVRKATYERLGLLRYKDFRQACDIEFLYRMTRARARVGHIREYVVRYRYHPHGMSADKRWVAVRSEESGRIRQEYGVPGGWVGTILLHYARLKRQAEKLVLLGKCDLIPGRWLLRKHMRDNTQFSSNIGLDKL
jgi:glycosyltransferase involved in cell wall biosynthesis